MDPYTPLLERTRVPQPSLQKFAVISIFSKLRSAPTHLGPDSGPGRDAILQCLHSSSPAVVDQSVREFCRLVADSIIDLSFGLVELQSALEGSDPKFVPLFVKGLGFVVRVGFVRCNGSWKFGSIENHPFVKVLSSGIEVHSELVQQVLLFMTQTKQLGMVQVCEFLKPFFNFSILRIPFSDSLSALFARQLVTSVSSICCSFPSDAMPLFKLLIGCLKYFPHRNSEGHKSFIYVVECIVDAYIVVLRHLVAQGSQLVSEAQMCGVELLETVFSLCMSPFKHSGGIEPIVEILKHALVAQHDLSLQYKPEISSDHNSQSGSFFLSFACIGGSGINQMDNELRPWTSQLKEYLGCIFNWKKNSRTTSGSQEAFSSEMSLLLCATASVLVMHPSLGNSAVDAFAAIGLLDSKLGVSLLLSILFYCNIFTRKDVMYQNMLPKLLGLLPSLASHSAMIPLVVQTILPMLHKDANLVLYATATRLLCQTWENNDRTFGSLQGVLNPKGFTEFMSERNICLSMAASVRDVCRKHPDRGVDLVLSVSACIESRDPIIQALGFQSLAHLCEADVIDFYTAWDVIAKHVLDYSLLPNLAHSLCLLLRWGAMDAEAYPETSRTVLKILWCAGTTVRPAHDAQWAKARASAFEALTQYDVSFIGKNISDFKQKSLELLFSETNQDVLQAVEGFQVKIITHEHITRRRFVKEKKIPGSKIEKLLEVFPQVIFSSGKSNAGELPGAALLCIAFSPKDLNKQGASRGLQDVHAEYENALVDIAPSLQLSRNIFVALLSLQSWKSFIRRWIRANVLSLNAKVTTIVLDKTSKAANNILKSMIRITEDSVPSSAENIALAIGALGAVLPPSAHTIKSTASKFLLGWLFQHEHEHRQWSAAISLGLISRSLHVTDHKQKFQNINGLLEVLCGSRSILVRGACGVGLGFSCQDLLTRGEFADDSNLDRETYKTQEMELLGRIVKVLSMRICQLAPSSSGILENLSDHFPVGSYDVDIDISFKLPHENFIDLEDDIWGVAGLVLGLASSIGVVYRTGAYDAVLKIKDLIISWIPNVNSLVQDSGSYYERSEIVLSVGSCLALPVVVAFCRKVELMDDTELDHLVIGYRELISELLLVNKSGNLYKSLLLASCVGAGSLLACILSEGVQSIKVDHVKCLLQLFKKCYSSPYPPIINLGGVLGVVNALGADAGFFVNVHPSTSSIHAGYAQKEHSYILGPILSNPLFEQHVTPLMQEIFLMAQNSNDHQLQQYAAWAMSFLRHHIWSKELLNIDSNIQTDASGSKIAPHSFPEDSIVMKLSSWLNCRNFSVTDTTAHVETVSTVLRCLLRAPRLPTLDWGVIIRRCMRYEAKVANSLPPGAACKRGTLREECVQFSLVHAKQFDPLLTFLDELSDISRFGKLELNLQAYLLFHLGDLIKLFSDSRLEKLFDDIADYFSSFTSFEVYNPDQKSFLRISCWKGLYQCLEEASLDSLEYIPNMEKCMEVLFTLLPAPQSVSVVGVNQKDFAQEWSNAVRCLGTARRGWLLDFLQVSHMDQAQDDFQLSDVLKKIQAKAKLVRVGSFQLTELGKLKAYILNFEPLGVWHVLVEVVSALQHADEIVKRQWLVDIVEISCVSRYPSTALQFLGLLAGSCCKYMPILTQDHLTVLNDLPLILSSLLSDPSWEVVAELFVSYLWVSTERIYNWATSLAVGKSSPSSQPIQESKKDMAAFLLQVMHSTCVCLKDYLPLEKQLKLCNMLVT
ncbi:protein RST1 isoform X3 [Mangifera indica]|uniref:protein RST1 isoform X3 n=1 Tax=Mangifera indica TaxID=29780 RepID=UPI001CF9B40C|nr:protein RST1 isoform X3 [Mangifera indica]